ncbi:hypothetical protein [Cryptosporangium minutisporangium]|uniref:BatC protein n=1 Tax=Cryptosporangium minutisporangium TaxID=113569 RepID=A0ABP6T8E6_9ACTN
MDSAGEGSGLPRPGHPEAGRDAGDAHRDTQTAPGTTGAAAAVAGGDLGVDAIPELNGNEGAHSDRPADDAGGGSILGADSPVGTGDPVGAAGAIGAVGDLRRIAAAGGASGSDTPDDDDR